MLRFDPGFNAVATGVSPELDEEPHLRPGQFWQFRAPWPPGRGFPVFAPLPKPALDCIFNLVLGPDIFSTVKTRDFVSPDVRWTVKTHGFVDPDVRWTVKTHGSCGHRRLRGPGVR